MHSEILLAQAENLAKQITSAPGNVHRDIGVAFNQLLQDALSLLEPEPRDWFEARVPSMDLGDNAPYPIKPPTARLAINQLLVLLRSFNKAVASEQPVYRVLPETSRIFIVHGHDGENALRLHRLLRDRWALEPVILADKPSQGRSVIEKFEDEAANCSFAFTLLTPDDLIKKPAAEYLQARPNVHFELGWFYGRLGRGRVCLLCKKTTAVPSDLSGIVRLEFNTSVDECILGVEGELQAVGILPR